MRRTIMIMTLIPVLTLLAAIGCQRRPLYYVDEPGVKVIVKVLWKVQAYPEGMRPSGITLYFFRDGKYYMQQTTADVDSCVVQLEPGKYKLYMITQSPEEYGMMQFQDMYDFDKASVSVAETKTKWYTKADDEMLIGNPEIMSAGVSDEFEVTDDIVENYQHYTHLLKERIADMTKAAVDEKIVEYETMVNYYTIRVPVYPKSIVSQYWVTAYSSNADALLSVRASTTGMARTFMLTQDKTADEEATQFITQWSLTMDDPDRRIGHIDGKITTFGYPRGEMPSPLRDPALNISTLLVDNETVEDFVFYVGDKITSEEPPTGYRSLYRLILGSVEEPAIELPDLEPARESGFDATVEDWEEGETIEIPM